MINIVFRLSTVFPFTEWEIESIVEHLDFCLWKNWGESPTKKDRRYEVAPIRQTSITVGVAVVGACLRLELRWKKTPPELVSSPFYERANKKNPKWEKTSRISVLTCLILIDRVTSGIWVANWRRVHGNGKYIARKSLILYCRSTEIARRWRLTQSTRRKKQKNNSAYNYSLHWTAVLP